ncbi:MAG TPA: DUF1707 domain-containing protein [Gemmatimonadaceae bacterium]|nr:DUF1707 domain-containing protein [Gemmatimonadaceae bacterium]
MARSDPESPQPGAPLSLERERELTVELLSQHFAVDNLSLDELDRRMEQVYRARTVAALRDITRDLPTAASAAERRTAAPGKSLATVDPFPLEHGRIVSIMAETKRHGLWQLPRKLDVWSVMAETRLDLTEAQLTDAVTEIHLRGIMAQVKIIVPPGVRVVVQTGAFMSSVSDELDEQPPVGSRAPVLRITGQLVMAELKIRVRRRELSGEE